MNRLTQAVNPLPTNPLETFNYDPVGNRTNSNQNGASIFNTANQLLEDANFTYQYDNNGNQTGKTAKVGGAVTQYEYDAENKLIRVVSPNNTANYKYDGLGRRVEKEVIAGTTTTTRYVYDNEDILLELDSANAIVARYTHGPGIDEPLIMEKNAQSFYYHADGLGSMTELTNQTGTVAQRYTYSSFGKIESQLDPNFVQPYTFTSREFDTETGLYYYRARYYDSTSGRFLQQDPVGFAGGINSYTYVGGNPARYLDPFGLYEIGGRGTTEGIRIELHNALLCFDLCTARETVVTSLTDSHPGDNSHSRGEACDIGGAANPGLTRSDAESCFRKCFPAGSYGQQEFNRGTDPAFGTHYHFQIPTDPYAPNLLEPRFPSGVIPNRRVK